MPTRHTCPAESPAKPKPPDPPAEDWERQKARMKIERRGKAVQARVRIAIASQKLDDEDAINLERLLQVVEAHQNNSLTPVEDFIVDLGWRWVQSLDKNYFTLTPDRIIEIVNDPDGLRSWFDDAVEITRLFNRRYAEAVAEKEKSDDSDSDEGEEA
jgi:hypothetical protein